MKIIKDKKGFFIIETMVVLAIVAVVITYVFVHFSNTYNKFMVGESYNNLNVTNAILNIKTYVEDSNIDYNTVIGDNSFLEISSISKLNTIYYQKLREHLNIKRVYLIKTDEFYANPSNLDTFDVKISRYLDTLSKVKSKFILVAELNDSSYGYMSIYNYNLELVGDPSNEYAVYVKNGTTFQDPGYIAEDRNGKKLDALITGVVDTNISATYYLNYTLEDITLRRKVIVYDDVYDFDYTGNYQVFTAPISGVYKVELWGSSGGHSNETYPSTGGYTKGEIYINEGDYFYVYVGGVGGTVTLSTEQGVGGYNGGGIGGLGEPPGAGGGAGGGGATDIRLISGAWDNVSSLRSRIMVAGGGGGGGHNESQRGSGGSLAGGGHTYGGAGADGTLQTGGGGAGGYYGVGGRGGNNGGVGGTAYSTNTSEGYPGIFGVGGTGGGVNQYNRDGGGGGGGGYYGGGGGGGGAGGSAGSGGGGSSFISGFTGANAINADGTHSNQSKHFSGYIFKNMIMMTGRQSFLSPTGTTETGHMGPGYARITLINPEVTNSLSKVRYIYNEINGSDLNPNNNHWVELQAYDINGNNISQGLTSITSNKEPINGTTFNYVTDGNTASFPYLDFGVGLTYIILDLGKEYDLSSIRLWHYYSDSRTYNGNKVMVAGTDEQYRVVMEETYVETSYGKVIRPESLN